MMKLLLIAFLAILVLTSSGCISDNDVKTEEEAQDQVADISKDIEEVQTALNEIDQGLG